MDDIFQALADPKRRAIVDLLAEGERSVSEIVAALDIAQSGVSRHLRILKEAGFVRSNKQGQRRLYSLQPEPFTALDGWMTVYRQVWEARFDAFGVELARRQSEASKESMSEKNASEDNTSEAPQENP
jgi:DNA-binding transcriptional ArsR family regulator